MPKAPRRSQRLQLKASLNWLPILDLALKQGHFSIEVLTLLYQTGKVVQTLFTNFWIRLEKIYEPPYMCEVLSTTHVPIHIPDTATWTIFFRCFKPNKKLRSFMESDPCESSILSFSLVVHGYVKLAKEIIHKTGERWEWALGNAVLLNGGLVVHEEALTELGLNSELLETCALGQPLTPFLFHAPGNPTFLWDTFVEEDGFLQNNSLLQFIVEIGKLRSTVALDFVCDSLVKDFTGKGESLQSRLSEKCHVIDNTIVKSMRETYTKWKDPVAQKLLNDFIIPLHDKIRSILFHF